MSEIDYKKLLADKVKFGGVSNLSDAELISVAIDAINNSSDKPISLANELLTVNGGDISLLFGSSYDTLQKNYRLTAKNAAKVAVIGEIARRVKLDNQKEVPIIKNSNDIVDLFDNYFRNLAFEEFWVIYLNNGNRVIEKRRAAEGVAGRVLVDVKIIIRHALNILATKIIVVHNHPSGSLTPSQEDIDITDKIAKAAEFFDIKLLDHIILSPSGEYYSIE